jgi:predicted Zn-dependent protease
MFEMLQRVSAAGGTGGRLPQWLSTHPDPENRIVKTDQRLDTLTVDLSKAKLNRDPFLNQLDGMVFGENPRQGFFEGSRFNHPDLAFRIDFPTDWKTQNQTAAVVGISPADDAILVLSIPTSDAPDQAIARFLAQQGVQGGTVSRQTVNGFPAAQADFQATAESGPVAGRVAFIQYGGKTYQVLGYTSAAKFSGYRSTFQQGIQSFDRLTDRTALNRQPNRISLVRLPSDMTVDEFQRRYPSVVPAATVALINALDATTDVMRRGQWAKRVQ